jgi:glucose dehydrogenase
LQRAHEYPRLRLRVLDRRDLEHRVAVGAVRAGDHDARFTAVDMRTNRIVWSATLHEDDARPVQRVMHDRVAGDGGRAGWCVGLPQGFYHGLAACNASTGSRFCRWNTAAGIEAPLVSYGVGGKQYVVVFAGGASATAYPSSRATRSTRLRSPAARGS